MNEFASEFFSLAIDVHVGASAEIDSLKGAGGEFLGLKNLFHAHPAAFVHEESLSGKEFVNGVCLHVKGGLDDGAFGGNDHDLVVFIPECRANAPRVAQRERLAGACDAADNISSVPNGRGKFQDVGEVDLVFNVACDIAVRQPKFLRLNETALTLAVQSVSELFEKDIGVRHHAGMLSLDSNLIENLLHVRHVEVRTETKVFGAPVVSSQEGMNIRKATLAGSRIPEVAHINFSCKRHEACREVCVMKLFFRKVSKFLLHVGKDFLNGSAAKPPFTENELLAGRSLHLHTSQAGAFLTAVVLLLHQQIEFVQAVHPRAVFLFIIGKRLEESHHCHTTFVLQSFHSCKREKQRNCARLLCSRSKFTNFFVPSADSP